MIRLIIILLVILTACTTLKDCCSQTLKKAFKFSTFYVAANGNTSLADRDIYSIKDGSVLYDTVFTPFDYSLVMGIRKIKRFQYEGSTPFKDGTESAYGDAATIGLSPFEYLFEVDYKRQEGVDYMDQHHFIRFSSDDGCEDELCINFFALKLEYLEDGFADIKYFEASERYRQRKGKYLSWNVGLTHRLAEPYGYNALDEWMLDNGNIHYTYLALQEGYTVDVYSNEYYNPAGELVATSAEVWEAVVIPQVLSDYTEKKRNELKKTIQHSLVVGFDYYKYTKKNWLHAWGSLMPWHYDNGDEFSYHNYIDGDQWYDYSFGLIYGIKQNKNLGYFLEGKYNKYWNREWYDFKLGLNYVIF